MFTLDISPSKEDIKEFINNLKLQMSEKKDTLGNPSNTSQKQKSGLSQKSTPQNEEKMQQDYFSEVRRQATEAHQYYKERFKTKQPKPNPLNLKNG